MSLKILEKEENAWRRIEQKSYFFRKRYYIPNIELDHEPYCPERTLLSKIEMNRYYRNPLLHEPTAQDKFYKQKVLDNPLENSDIYGIKDSEKSYHAPPDLNPQSFGYRPGEGGHHFDALTLSVKKPKQKKLPAEPDGLLSAARLNTLLHSKVKTNQYTGDPHELELLLRAPSAKAMSDITCKPHKPTYEESLEDPIVQKEFEDTVIPPKIIKNGTLTPIEKSKKKNKKELYLKELESGFDNTICHTHQIRQNSAPILTRQKQINNKEKYAKLAANKLTTTLCTEKIMTDDILKTMFPDTIDRYKREDEGNHREYLCRSVVHTTTPRPMRKKLFGSKE